MERFLYCVLNTECPSSEAPLWREEACTDKSLSMLPLSPSPPSLVFTKFPLKINLQELDRKKLDTM